MPETLIRHEDRALVTELAEPLRRKLLEPGRKIGYDLPQLGLSPLPEERTFWQAPTGSWWLFDSFERDPTAQQFGGRIPVPAEPHAKLTELQAGGLAADLIWIGHELDPDWSPGRPLPTLVPSPPAGTTRPPGESPSTGAAFATHLAQALYRAGQKLGRGSLSFGAAVGASLAELDPVVLGGVKHPRAPVVAWVELARWTW